MGSALAGLCLASTVMPSAISTVVGAASATIASSGTAFCASGYTDACRWADANPSHRSLYHKKARGWATSGSSIALGLAAGSAATWAGGCNGLLGTAVGIGVSCAAARVAL